MSTLSTNLVSYWKLDGNSTDSVASNDGSDTSITYNAGNGISIQGAGFNGSSSNISVANDASLNFVGAAFSVSCWVKPSTEGAITTSSLLNKAQASTANGWGITLYNGIRALGSTTYNPSYTFEVDTWYHVVFTFDGSATGKFYINGSILGSGGTYHNDNAWTGALLIGKASDSSDLFAGAMDEIGIWSRELSAGEVTELYRTGLSFPYPFNSGNFLPFL